MFYCTFHDEPNDDNYIDIDIDFLGGVYKKFGMVVIFVDSAPCHESAKAGRFL